MFKILVVFFLFITLAFSESHTPIKNKTVNIDTLSQKAKSEHKHVLLFFHKFGCGFCEKMIDVTLENNKVDSLIKKHFIFVDINIDDEGRVKHKSFVGDKHAYAKSLGISLYPTVMFLDGNNHIVHSVIGYRGKESFLKVLLYLKSKSYKSMGFEAFKTKLDFESDR